ncbi:MAG TPA: mandelate racemase/muconate lactonizing enzyme family protein [Casimicrobiaceae bacterium]|jgi:L-alanine-DL-glutamate epimerase-like enolase superfamily enzyme|nr:mandelate racemase/muconate lactonizing enzyme family protein [Casimicrobiaceae bacterium]
MRIVRVAVLEFYRRLDGRSWNPTMRWHERRAPLLVLETDAGLCGVGEAWSRQPEIALVLDYLAERCASALVGRDPKAREQILAELAALPAPAMPWVAAAAASAVDIALWDLAAQANAQPLWRELGGDDGRVPVYASGGLYRDGASAADLVREFRDHVDQGFTIAKMKIGALPLDADLGRVRAVRDAVGDRLVLWVDAVNQLTRASAPAWCAGLARLGVVAIQAPLPFDDVAGMAALNAGQLGVVAAEAEHREEMFVALLEANAVSHLQYCLGLCGGLSGAMRLDALAAEHHVTSTPQCFSTAVLQAASLHLGAARENVVAVEFHRFHDHLAAALPSAMRTITSGCVQLDDEPGLGVGPPSPGEQPGGGEVRLYRQIVIQH